ncbi:TolC family protein [Cytophagaceae bacterium YF14B1]|uniref:TolC family protein n=1 Tax=Xanthocytophaga flava TaxID=3048013 RepID=A0AAE3QNT1_9BACT|nr:TolC family protein [Xanthocytophaga flavus]MDJ1482757.1 TolC family protein [Xanthocytophaga flavus]
MRRLTLFIVGWLGILSHARAQIILSSFADVVSVLEQKSYLIKNGKLEEEKAKKSRLAGILSIPEPTGSISLGYTNNTRLPVTVFPAEILGGTPGTYEKVALGVQYNTNFNSTIDIKLINATGIQNFKLSQINSQLVVTENALQKKSLYENAATVYYNILILQEQKNATMQFIENAEQLLLAVTNQFTNGLATQQQVNEATISRLTQQDNLKQIQYQIELQINTLQSWMDIREPLEFVPNPPPVVSAPAEPLSRNLHQRNALLSYEFARTEFRKEAYTNLPYLSLILSSQRQLFDTQANPFASSQSWVPSSYYGFRVSIPIPGNASVSGYYRQKYQVKINQFNLEKAIIQDELEVRKLETNLRKAQSEHASALEIERLRKETYDKNLLNYQAGLVTLEDTINSLNASIDAQYTRIASAQKVKLQEQFILIHNSIK